MKRVALSWSSGKDSAWALHVLKQTPGVEVVALITTFNCVADRVAMHAVRRRLVEAQAERVQLPLWPVELPWPCANGVYEELMAGVCRRATDEKINTIAFGDLYLRSVREYRERQLQSTGLEPLFPLWDLPTSELARDMVRTGVKAKVTCVDPRHLDRSYAGRNFDMDFISSLPSTVDPCGENGEFHSFVYGSPVFSSLIDVHLGEIVERDGFIFADLL
ncbi:MAG: ATP-binding protein [Bryobacteraceae bacterium]